MQTEMNRISRRQFVVAASAAAASLAVLGRPTAAAAATTTWTAGGDVLRILSDPGNEEYLGRLYSVDQYHKVWDKCGPALRDAIKAVHVPAVYHPGTSVPVGSGRSNGIKVGSDGQCVAFSRAATNAPHTSNWRQGRRVVDGGVAVGTVIATFIGGSYSGHTGLYKGPRTKAIAVWHQNYGVQAVTTCVLPDTGRGGPGDARAYYVVLT